MQKPKILNAFVYLGSALCFVFFVILFASIRFESDDMIIINTFSNHSFLEVLIDKYQSTSFRPLFIVASFLTTGYHVADVNEYYTMAFIYFLSVYLFFVFSIYKLLKEIFSFNKAGPEPKLFLIAFANLLFGALYFLTTEKIEIFGWYCCITVHLLPVAISCFATWMLIKKQKHKTDFVFLFICALQIAGGAEHIPIAVLAGISVVGALLFFEKRKDKKFVAENKHRIFKIVFFAGVLALFFILFVTNPGIWSHYSKEQSKAIKAQSNIDFMSTLSLFAKSVKLIGVLILFTAWTVFNSKEESVSGKIRLKYFIAVFVTVFFVAAFTGAIAYNTWNVGRVWFVADVALFVLVNALIIKFNAAQTTFKVFVAGLTLTLLIWFDVRHIPTLLTFSSEHDKAVADLRLEDSGKVVTLNYFPLPDLTNQVPLSKDPNNEDNQLFCRFYGIKSKVALVKKQ